MSEFTGYKYEDLDIGMSHETVHVITEDDIQRFAEVSGDFNPLHMSDDFAAKTIFGKRIAHGALTASYISGILGNNLPGPVDAFQTPRSHRRRSDRARRSVREEGAWQPCDVEG